MVRFWLDSAVEVISNFIYKEVKIYYIYGIFMLSCLSTAISQIRAMGHLYRLV